LLPISADFDYEQVMTQFILIAIFLYTALIVAGRVQIARYRKNTGWKLATGRVTEVDVRLEAFRQNNFYEVTIKYEYTVGDNHYVGSARHPEVFFNKEGAHEVQENFPIGAEVEIQVNPKQENESKLNTYAEGYRAAAIGAAFSTVFVFLMVAFVHFKHSTAPSATGLLLVVMAAAFVFFMLRPLIKMFRSE
jgi:hypothetical protein